MKKNVEAAGERVKEAIAFFAAALLIQQATPIHGTRSRPPPLPTPPSTPQNSFAGSGQGEVAEVVRKEGVEVEGEDRAIGVEMSEERAVTGEEEREKGSELGGEAEEGVCEIQGKESVAYPPYSSPLPSPLLISESGLLSLWGMMKYTLFSTLSRQQDSLPPPPSTSSALPLIHSPLIYEALRSMLFHPLQIERDFKRTPFHAAALCGDLALTHFLLKENAKAPMFPISTKDTLGNTVLHFLAATGLSCPCDPPHPFVSSACSIDTPIRASHLLPPDLERISFFLREYYQIGIGDYHWMMAELVRGGCGVNDRNKFGQTPLHFACRFRNIDGVTWLLQCGGADPNISFDPLPSSVYSLDGIGGDEMVAWGAVDNRDRGGRGRGERWVSVSPLSISLSTNCSRISKENENDRFSTSFSQFLSFFLLMKFTINSVLKRGSFWNTTRCGPPCRNGETSKVRSLNKLFTRNIEIVWWKRNEKSTFL